MIEKFKFILDKENTRELIPFLRSLSKEEKKELNAEIKRISKDYIGHNEVRSNNGSISYVQKSTQNQRDILYLTAFVCGNRKEYEKIDEFNGLLRCNLLEEILELHCPEWFSDIVNELESWWGFNYDTAMKFTEKGFLRPSDELIVKLLPHMIFHQGADRNYSFIPESLTSRDITLKEHIWLLFKHESQINHSGRYMQFQNGENFENGWYQALKTFSDEGKIDRNRILKESLLASSRNFNKVLSGWFIDLFEFLKPTKDELISLQPELFIAMNSQYSKVINTILGSLKQISGSDNFNSGSLLENIPLLLSSETKSVVSSTLTLLEKIAGKNPNLNEQICTAICQAFIHSDEAIQSKTSKILVKFHNDSKIVRDEINKYSDSMLMSSKKALSDLLSAEIKKVETVETRIESSNEIKPLQEIKTIDELIFLASQAFDNNDSSHMDLLPAAFVNLQDQITDSVLPKFEPALQRAYKMVMGDWPSNMGYLDHLLATFFIDLTRLFIERFPVGGESLNNIHELNKAKDEELKAKWTWYNQRILELETWRTSDDDTTYLIHKTLLLAAYEKIKDREHTPFLSTPTHEFGYVDPAVFVQRLKECKKKNILPGAYDFQVAISRLASFNHQRALEEAKETLKDETLGLVEFLFTKDSEPVPPYSIPALWYMAGISKSPKKSFPEFKDFIFSTLPKSLYTGDVQWNSIIEQYTVSQYNFEKKKSEEVPAERKVLRIKLNDPFKFNEEEEQKKEGVLTKLSKLFSSKPKEKTQRDIYLVYEFLSLKGTYLSAEQNDIQRFIYLFPNNPNPLLALVASKSLIYGSFISESDKKMVTKTLEAIINLNFQFSEITHLFAGTCMLTNDKTVRSFAAEMWIKAVKSGNVNSDQLGKIIGLHLKVGYAPMKRFTDLISENLVQVSSLHNHELEILLNAVLLQLSNEPPVGTKRLLEQYSEILAVNISTIKSEELRSKLNIWSSTASLKKIISVLKN